RVFRLGVGVGGGGERLAAHRVVAAEDIRSGRVLPRRELAAWIADDDYPWLRSEFLDYCEQLERRGRYQLYLWPPHCLVGSPGHTMVGVVQEARLFHAY